MESSSRLNAACRKAKSPNSHTDGRYDHTAGAIAPRASSGVVKRVVVERKEVDVRDREQWFAGQVAIVVGATGGIGAAICEEFAERGAGLRMIGRDSERLASIAADVQGAAASVETAVVDLRDRPGLTEAIDGWADASVLVNAAGMNSPGPFTDIPEADYDSMMDANVSGVFWASRAFVRARRATASSGCIINITSQMGHVGAHHRVAYCASKHAVEGMTKAMAVELAAEGWRVNAVAPTFVETELTAQYLAAPEQREYVMSSIPQGRMATTRDVANAVAFLASDLANSTTGTSLLVDGGWTAK